MEDTRLLYVEGSRVSQKMLDRVMSQIADVALASDLAEARQAIQSQDFTFFILDYELPDGDGLQLARELRADPRHAKTPIILYCSSLNNELEYEAMVAGVNESVKKPMDMLELRERVVGMIDLPTVRQVRRQLLQMTCFVWLVDGKWHEYSPDLDLHLDGESEDELHDRMHAKLQRHVLDSVDPSQSSADVRVFKHVIPLDQSET